jgi:hypothetical protein
MSRSVMETMTAADRDVGSARAAARARPHRAPASPLARLLLYAGHRLFVLLLLLPAPACIVPVGPEFRDPPGIANAPPFIVSSKPIEGEIWHQNLFTVTPFDPNLDDTLYLRWVIDYPPFVLGVTFPFDGEVIPPPINGTPDTRDHTFFCSNLREFPSHQVSVIVADRPFADSRDLDELLNPDGHSVTVSWTWIAQCSTP